MSIPCLVSDTTKPLSLTQVDSLIRLSEKFKSLSERYDFAVQERAGFKFLWESEKEARQKDKKNNQGIIDGYAAIETTNRIEIAGLKKDVRKATVGKRVWQVIAAIIAAFAAYQTFLK